MSTLPASSTANARDCIVTVAAYRLASWLVVERFEGLAWSRPKGVPDMERGDVSKVGEAGGTGAAQCEGSIRSVSAANGDDYTLWSVWGGSSIFSSQQDGARPSGGGGEQLENAEILRAATVTTARLKTCGSGSCLTDKLARETTGRASRIAASATANTAAMSVAG